MISIEKHVCTFSGKSQFFFFFAFKNFKALVEKENDFEIKSLRFIRGGEFTLRKLSEFCATHGICHPMIVLKSPQQNGVVERNNETILK